MLSLILELSMLNAFHSVSLNKKGGGEAGHPPSLTIGEPAVVHGKLPCTTAGVTIGNAKCGTPRFSAFELTMTTLTSMAKVKQNISSFSNTQSRTKAGLG